MRFDRHFIKEAVPNIIFTSDVHLEQYQFSIDTRTLSAGDIFIALKGVHVDGHHFIKEALHKGAAGVIIQRDKHNALNDGIAELKNKLVMTVPDTHETLLLLAHAWRKKFIIPIVGITGSVGKTSTKELLAAIVRNAHMDTFVSHGTENTEIGCALNLLRLRAHHQIGIFEMGINKRGEMAKLAQLVQPTTAIITNVGHSHMEGLGSLQDIALEKRDIFKFFKEDSIGIINGDLSLLGSVAYSHPVIKCGSKTVNQVQARKISINSDSISFTLKLYREKYTVTLKKNHEGAIFNALVAAAAAHLLGIPSDNIIQGLESETVVPRRFEKRYLRSGMGILIDDCYNANPESMKAALLAFEKIKTNAEKIVILGDMHELGVNSPFWHRQIGRFLRKVPSVKRLILVGDLVKWTKKTMPVGVAVELVSSWQEASELIKKQLLVESCVLVKGSNSMKLSNLVDELSSSQ